MKSPCIVCTTHIPPHSEFDSECGGHPRTRPNTRVKNATRARAARGGYGWAYISLTHVRNGSKYCPGVAKHDAGSICARNAPIHTTTGLYSQFRSVTRTNHHPSLGQRAIHSPLQQISSHSAIGQSQKPSSAL